MANKTIAQYTEAPGGILGTDELLLQRGNAYYKITRAALVAGLSLGGGAGLVDANYGDITVSNAGTVMTINSGAVAFSEIASKPTTLAGYGIVDGVSLSHVGAGGGVHADVVESGASGFMTGAMAAKLAGIAANATANSSDATLLARANHTGTQAASTIQDFAEAVQDVVGGLLVAGSNITLNYNDTNGTLTISAAGGGGGATLADGDYGDITASSIGTVLTIDPGAVTLAKMADLPTQRLIGRATAGSGVPEQLSVTGGIEFTAGGIQTSAYTGDVTKSAGGTALTIAAGSVTYAKMQNIASDSLIGRDTAGSGAPEAITLNSTLEFTGTQQIQRAALTGDVTAGAGSNATTIAAGAVTLAKMANLAQDQVIGRVTASTGVPETFTVTAAARSVLDDTTVDAMLNTLGGATATGTGAVVRANTPTLVTPVLGAATGTSLSLGGGTALTTTNRTGTGNLVLATDPTLTRPVFSGITTSDSANVTTPNVVTITTNAGTVDVTKGLNTASHNADVTLSFSGTPASANTWFGLLYTNSDAAPHILTIPSSFDMGRQAAVTTVPIAASGRLMLWWHYNGSGYNLFGASGYLNKYDATTAPGVGDDVADGYGPGSLWLNATSNLAYICESNAAGAAVWNVLGGGISDADYGDVTVSGGVWTIDAGVVTLAKLANIATDTLIGRDTTGTGVPEAIGVTGGIEFSGTGSIRTSAFTGDVTKTAGGTALTIANGAVSLAKMADLVTARFIGRVSGTTGVPEALTGTQATTLLDVFTSALKGLVPPSGGGTATYLRADGTWATPAGSGTVTATAGNLTNNSVVLGAGTTDTKVVAGIVTDGVSKLTLGVAGASVGGLLLANATSGTVELRPVTGALGSAVISVPAVTDTMVALAATQTLTNKTISGANNTLTVRLANDVTGNLPVANLNSGTGASASTFWRGDGTWASAGGALGGFMENGPSFMDCGQGLTNTMGSTGAGVGATVTSGSATSPAVTSLFDTSYNFSLISLSSAAAANAYIGRRTNTAGIGFYPGAAGTAPLKGRFIGAPRDASTSCRFFMGFTTGGEPGATAETSTLLDCFGIGADSTDTNMQLMHNDGSGSCTKVDLGANFPANSNGTEMYELEIYGAPGSTREFRYVVYERTANPTPASGTITTNIPTAGIKVVPLIWRNAVANSGTAPVIYYGGMYTGMFSGIAS